MHPSKTVLKTMRDDLAGVGEAMADAARDADLLLLEDLSDLCWAITSPKHWPFPAWAPSSNPVVPQQNSRLHH
jgi:hypothetical protein